MNTLFGNELIQQDQKLQVNYLNNYQIIGIYFSGSHCPPCQKFTPILSDVYTQLKNLEKNNNTNRLEIVFISSDKDIESFNKYYKKMPWLTIPYEKRNIK